MKIKARSNIASIKPYVPGRPVSEVARELGLRDVIKLASNENALGPSPKAREAIRACLDNIHRYPEADQIRRLKDKISKQLGCQTDEIIIGNGSNEILELATRAFVNPDDEILTAQSTFLVYEGLIRIAAAKGVFVPLKNDAYDLDALSKRVSDRTKLIFVSNPNNPTGTAVTRTQVECFIGQVPDHVLIIFDEAYYDFTDPETFPDLLKNRPDNVMVIRTFSKSYGLAGLRVGYGIADSVVAQAMNKVRQPFNVNMLALVAAEAALGDTAYLESVRKMVREGRAFLEDCFKSARVSFVKSEANFVLFSLPMGGRQASQAFLKQGIIVREMDAYGFKNALRVTVGTQNENQRFAEALKKILIE